MCEEHSRLNIQLPTSKAGELDGDAVERVPTTLQWTEWPLVDLEADYRKLSDPLCRCSERATEVVNGVALCWSHARREERIAKDGFSLLEKRVGLDVRRFCGK